MTFGKEVVSRISIHAPRGGSDALSSDCYFLTNNFNPRSPWGERRAFSSGRVPVTVFQSTLPVGGATAMFVNTFSHILISIHAPRGGSDQSL